MVGLLLVLSGRRTRLPVVGVAVAAVLGLLPAAAVLGLLPLV
jgi:hypothetical protein